MIRPIASAGLFFALFGAAAFAQEGPSKPVVVDIVNAQGHSVGTAALSEAPNGVKIKLDIKSLPPGPHLMHIHQFAKCDPPDFKSAGAHFMGGVHDHASVPAGDIPNFVLTVHEDGTAHTTVVAPFVTMGSEASSVFSNGGTALVIHAVAVEVNASAPPRIACGLITKPD
jgi:superoxide dismutase, Cu-Zn family